ncbi:phage replisome organizer N-terminal domain-containing protein [uncultured Enterococcus sp.]|uniref:phage replisome organizer N-terminal domain-containing protein n=1 Tax=uncultured Enterococcus sp. TaxID=167972 RepID=UPI002AA5F529|nr:phage replisome organizer N-terminal domain-containing protein [uncultured Enterococcus sp.]
MSKFKNDPKAKRYYWLKLKTDFFEQKEIKLLRRIAGGDTYTIIYLKMLLKSLKNEGKLFYEFYGDNFAEEIALDIDENPEDVAMTIQYLETKGLIELVEQDEYFLNKVPDMIGSESYSAERMRNMRKRKLLQSDGDASQCDNNVFSSDEEIEIEIEKDIELEKSNSNSNSKEQQNPHKKIFTFWEQNGFGCIASKTVQDLDYWVKDFEKIGATTTAAIDLILHALGIAVDNGVKKYAYVNSILKDWEQNRFLTVEQVKAEDKKNRSGDDKRQWPDYRVEPKLENTGSNEYDNLGW